MKRKFTNVFWQEGEKTVGLCLELDISSFGSTQAEAEIMLREAVELSLGDMEEKDYRFPNIKNPKLIASEISLSHA